MQISASYTSASLSVTGTASESASSRQPARGAGAGDRVTLSDRSRELAFSLDLGYEHLSVAAESAAVETGPEGGTLTCTGISAEVSMMTASFTMASAGDSAKGRGAHLNDEVSQITKDVKPFVKAFAAAAGLEGGWGQVNRLLRSVV